MALSKDFLWGAASAAAQVEGAWDEDGKCPSIWDEAGAHIRNGDTCHTACDHYHRYREDVALMKELGLNSYRFSVSMCRVMPEEGRINQKGLDFYRNLVRELRNAGIEPLCTLYHWDLPVWAQKRGGWKNKRIVDWYLAYAEAVVDALSDEVRWWMTFNEPQCFIMLGYDDDGETKKKAVLRLKRAAENFGFRVGTGFLSTPFLLPVLSENGEAETACRMLENEESPGWLHEVREGATTVWEDWEGKLSRNHYSPGAVTGWLFSGICGIRLTGERRFEVSPVPGGSLTHAEASWRSIYGEIGSKWEKRDGKTVFTISVPSNCAAVIRLPDGTAKEVSAGRYEYEV